MSRQTDLGGTIRLLRFLRLGPATRSQAASPGKLVLQTSDHGSISVDAALVGQALRDGLVVEERSVLRLDPAGRAYLTRTSSQGDAFAGQHRIEITETREEAGEAIEVVVNGAESPLSALRRRKGADGTPFLSHAEFSAGERLRSDFTRGNLMPRITANWEAHVSSGRRGGGIAELTDAALAARLRVERAVAAVGPELAGILIDVCCFLKGLETVERERRWPQRSAKVVLKAALGALDRHYRPPARTAARPAVLHWGSEDYRPEIGAP
jgi:hypothetical protein